MDGEETFVPVTCVVNLRRGAKYAALTLQNEERSFVVNISFADGAMIKMYDEIHHINLSAEGDELDGSRAAMIFFARKYRQYCGGDFRRAKVCHDVKKRICVILGNENKEQFKLNLVDGLILARQVGAKLLIDKELLEKPEETEAVKKEESDDFDIGLD